MARSRKGIKSSAQDNFLPPSTPTSPTATNVGTNRPYLATANTTSAASAANTGGAVSLSWTLPANSPAATSYTITSTPSTYTVTTGTSATSYTFQGLASATSYTFTIVATNAYGSSSGVTTGSVTATTVPQTITAPTATSPSAGTDTVSWSAPNNGGSSITNYHWESTDSKSGDTGSTSVNVSQEQGTSQQYRVYATNANGNSAWSDYSASVTTTFSFVPFGAFGFTPFGAFGFTPFGAFGFTPFGAFGFSPTTWGKSIGASVLIKTINGFVPIQDVQVGDQLISSTINNLSTLTSTDGSPISEDINFWADLNIYPQEEVVTTVTAKYMHKVNTVVVIDGEVFSDTHYILIKRQDVDMFIIVTDVVESDLIYSTSEQTWKQIVQLEKLENVDAEVVCLNVAPYDVFFTENIMVHDSHRNVD